MSEILNEPPVNTHEDLWVVCNICVGDDSIDLMYGGSREDYFEVRWAGKPLCIPPGETRIVPEYLADHFAKHLVDYLLTRDKVMIHDETFRAPLFAQIKLRKADESDRPSQTSDGGANEPIETLPGTGTEASEPQGLGNRTDEQDQAAGDQISGGDQGNPGIVDATGKPKSPNQAG